MSDTEITYSTAYQAFMSIYGKTLKDLYDGYAPDQALYRIMKSHPLEFSKAIDEYIVYKATDAREGYHIQKRFRTLDVMPALAGGGDMDMAIWYLMSEARIFWQIEERLEVLQTLH